jgi:hypothetical protein
MAQIITDIPVQLENRDRQSVLLRLFMMIPVALFLGSFDNFANDAGSFVTGLVALPAVLTLLFFGVYPSYCLAFNKSLLSLNTRALAYFCLLTDKYPTIEESDMVSITYPDIDGGRTLNRGLPLVKWLLALPLYLVGVVYAIYAGALVIVSWFTIIAGGNMSASAADVIVRTIQFWNRVYGYAIILVTDEYPSFSL